ncbi:putative acyl carrier protein [Actinoplanes missouriensis 431]|uniref:Putative acyl carrier protein n=1 Tax=Actinoplanes missouriensis (strain ATCC 14538 / DSM 43046 / CBS 188.64 / JCM 3121 / NBRC 102363 / NCIMB 12654 / NRRL B-3342 / UNCC 431) TaxID=512565 RepID=I0HB77_ACTM4|nr:acyl carrier protein [Actinoplanes missouriensis]BAL90264.1 putative acyl carrier protein [Actinoplanes missouriensis 431]
MTIDDLRRILTECAGEDESVNLSGDILDTPFTDLGYDSLALIETAARIKQDFGIEIPDEQVATILTPRMMLETVHLAA